MRPSRILAAGLMVLLALAGAAPVAEAAPVSLQVGKGQVIRLSRPAATVFVAEPAIADVQVKSPGLIYVFGKSVGQTTLIAADEADGILLEAAVDVSHDLARLDASVRRLLPERDIRVSSEGGAILVEGAVTSPTEAEDLRKLVSSVAGNDTQVLNRVRITAPTQVNLRVRVAEMSRNVTKELGFRLAGSGSLGDNLGLAFATANPFSGTALGSVGAAFRGGFDLNGIIDALEQDQLVKLLAEPNLTAMSGQTASFLAGGEFPIAFPVDRDRVAIEFKEFGVSLAFTPTVLSDGRINLHVRPEVSELSQRGAVEVSGFSIPALTSRRAETTVEVASGQSFAIAGLLRSDSDQNVAKFPGLGDLPVLGALFRSSQFQRNETELVIIVTPYAVAPVSGRLAAPTDGVLPPHDVERLLFGAQWRDQNPRRAGLRGLAGPVGFELR
ncbi:type II and III secretion system protein family protein [Arenibaculum pallidiluteum]|uniref:type II and III secretion system protein family protein n=1 Tax=Arenibaculum pallidiluteum TaxID=2812559 RepID=UPI001A95C25E|nr:type II and III secretion system protein family protein [Arenibaculum pallidiluteum]